MLEHYGQILPGGVEWILAQTERQITHRHSLETTKLQSDIKREATGQWMALVVTLAVVGVGGVLIYTGRSTALGFSLIVAQLAALAFVFINGRRVIAADLQRKREELDRAIEGR